MNERTDLLFMYYLSAIFQRAQQPVQRFASYAIQNTSEALATGSKLWHNTHVLILEAFDALLTVFYKKKK